MRHTTYAEGTPSWVDLSTPDTAATTAFYGGVFGWTPVEAGPETGGYIRYELDGVAVAGAGPLMTEGQPVFWSSYFAVKDADATAAKVASAGGQTFVAPMDVLDLGR